MIIEEAARVVAVDGDQAWVVTRRRSACGACAANKGCGTGIMARALGSERTLRIKAENTVQALVGEDVTLGIDDRVLLRSAVLMYLLPLLALIAGAVLGELLNTSLSVADEDYLPIITGMSAMTGMLWWLRRHSHVLAATGEYQPRILRRQGVA